MKSASRPHVMMRIALVLVFVIGMRGALYRLRIQFGSVDGSFLDDRATQITFFAVYVAAAAVGLRSLRLAESRRLLVPLAALSIVLVASSMWSIDAGRTLGQSFQLVAGTSAVLILVSALDEGESLRALVIAGTCATAISIVAVALDWEWSTDSRGRMTGVFFNRNALGMVTCLTLFAAVVWWWTRRHDHRSRLIAGFVCTAVLVVWWRTGSATGMFAAVAAVATSAWVVARQRYAGRFRRLIGAVPAVAVLGVVALVWARDTVTRWVGRDASLTGRTDTWDVIIEAWSRRPVLGYGFFAGWFDPGVRAGVRAIGYNHWEAHNGYLEVLFGAGLVGAAALVWLLGATARVLRAHLDDPRAPWWTGSFVFFLVANVGETNIAANRIVWFLFVVIVAETCSPRRSLPSGSTVTD